MEINLNKANIKESDAEGSRFLFSVVMPVYNVEKYAAGAIKSLVRQTIGFEKNIQLILVNDGSSDSSGEICRKYAECFPENIIYIEQKNCGVSAARNVGLSHAEGRYVNFMDSYDKWSKNAFAAAAEFFKEHPDVKITSAKMIYFGEENAPHDLNFKFETDAVIDIRQNPDYILLSLCNLWFERSLLNADTFNTQMKIGEDSLFVNQILLKELRYGVIKDPVYWCRQRQEGTSEMNSIIADRFFYIPILECFHEKIFEISRQLYGYIIPYAQYCVMYDLQRRLQWKSAPPLSENETEKYIEKVISLLREIDDEIILTQRGAEHNQMLSALALKRGVPTDTLRSELRIINDSVFLTDSMSGPMLRLWDAKWERGISITGLKEQNNEIFLEGTLRSFMPRDRICVTAEVSGTEYPAEIFIREDLEKNSFFFSGGNGGRWHGFRISFPVGSFSLHLYLNGFEEKIWLSNQKALSAGGSSWSYEKTDDQPPKKAEMILESRIIDSVPSAGGCRVSVIIPVYNTEKYLAECVESAMNQTLRDIEIICVDDGSSDSSPRILSSLVQKDARVRIFTKENGGQSSARNLALRNAKGEYVLFLDSDDYLVPDALRILYSYAKYDNIDELFYGASVVFESEELKAAQKTYSSYSRKWFYPDIKCGKDLFIDLCRRGDFKVSPCLQLIRRGFLKENGISFYEGIIREDELFTLQCISLAERTRVLDKELYMRRVREGSTMTQDRDFSHSYGLFICVKEMLKFIEKYKLWKYPEFYVELMDCLFSRCELSAREITGMDEGEFWENVNAMSGEDRDIYMENIYPWRLSRQKAGERINRLKNGEVKELQKQLTKYNKQFKSFRADEKSCMEEYENVKSLNEELEAKIKSLRIKNKKLRSKLRRMKKSSIWKTGSAVMWLPRRIRCILKKSSPKAAKY